jgi:hypothetical protein
MSHGPELPKNNIDTTEAKQILRQFEDETADPQIAELARYIADQLPPETDPEGFALTSFLSLFDLTEGKDSITDNPIASTLANLSGEEQDRLIRHIPAIAHTAFDSDFAVEVRNSLIRMELLPDTDTGERAPEYYEEIINTPIDNITDAYIKVIENAKHQLLQLDWRHFGLSREEVVLSFEITYGSVLRNSSLDSPVTLAVDEPGKEAGLLQNLLPHQKKQIQDIYWLILQRDIIPPELATLAKDDLFLRGAETIAAYNHINRDQAFARFANERNNLYHRTLNRWREARAAYPDFFK